MIGNDSFYRFLIPLYETENVSDRSKILQPKVLTNDLNFSSPIMILVPYLVGHRYSFEFLHVLSSLSYKYVNVLVYIQYEAVSFVHGWY